MAAATAAAPAKAATAPKATTWLTATTRVCKIALGHSSKIVGQLTFLRSAVNHGKAKLDCFPKETVVPWQHPGQSQACHMSWHGAV